MTRNAFVARTALVLLLGVGNALAQAPAAAPAPAALAPAPAAAAPKPTLAPPPAAAGATGPDAPVGKVTQELQAKLETMMRGSGLTAREVAERAVKNSHQVSAKRKAIESADAAVD